MNNKEIEKDKKKIWTKMSERCKHRDYCGAKICYWSSATISAKSLVCSYCCCPIRNKID